MKPGRQLDELIATKVMGLNAKEGLVFEKRTVACPDGKPGCAVKHYEQVPIKPKPYSTDIRAAWEVVEKLETTGILTTIQMERGGCFWVEMHNQDIESSDCESTCDTAPHAICLAALKAVDYGDKKD